MCSKFFSMEMACRLSREVGRKVELAYMAVYGRNKLNSSAVATHLANPLSTNHEGKFINRCYVFAAK